MADSEKLSWRSNWLFALFLLAATLIAYSPAMIGGYIWDDEEYVEHNPLLVSSDGLRRLWFTFDSKLDYFPLTHTSFYIERNFLWGGNPAGYHIVNIMLHAVSAIVLWLVLTRLGVPGARLAAGIFALHPVQVDSVAWITERKNVLMGVFFLLSLMWWVKFIDAQCKRPCLCYAVSLICAALALFAKTTACTLPAALFLILWLKRIPIDWRRIVQIAVFAFMGIAMGLVMMKWVKLHPGLQPKVLDISLGQRALIASHAIWFYAGKLFWPANLSICYPRWSVSTSDPLAYAWVAALAVLAVGILWARRWLGRGPEVGVVFFVATLSPMLCIIMHYFYVYSFVADHFQYLACIGIIALAAGGLELGLQRIAAAGQVLYSLCGAFLLTILGVLTWKQSHIYANNEILWRTTLRQNPDSLLAHASLGTIAAEDGQPEVAVYHFQKALTINSNFAQLHYDLGLALFQLGRVDDAIAQYNQEIAIAPSNYYAYNNLGLALARQGRWDQALVEYQKALAIDSTFAPARRNAGAALLKLGRIDKAVADFQKVLETDPDATDVALNLAVALVRENRVADAIDQLQKVLSAHPADLRASVNLAWLLATAPDAKLRDGSKAQALAQQAVDTAGENDPLILQTLAAAQAELGDYKAAAATARGALELAVKKNNEVLASDLRAEIKLYDSGHATRDPASRWDYPEK